VVQSGDEAEQAASELVLTLPDERTIAYTLHPQHIERIVRDDETIRHRETYPLVAAARGWQGLDDQASPIVSLEFELQASRRGDQIAGDETYRVDAVVNVLNAATEMSQP
jgi:hypothetical protein